jgi:hypothetical protein
MICSIIKRTNGDLKSASIRVHTEPATFPFCSPWCKTWERAYSHAVRYAKKHGLTVAYSD